MLWFFTTVLVMPLIWNTLTQKPLSTDILHIHTIIVSDSVPELGLKAAVSPQVSPDLGCVQAPRPLNVPAQISDIGCEKLSLRLEWFRCVYTNHKVFDKRGSRLNAGTSGFQMRLWAQDQMWDVPSLPSRLKNWWVLFCGDKENKCLELLSEIRMRGQNKGQKIEGGSTGLEESTQCHVTFLHLLVLGWLVQSGLWVMTLVSVNVAVYILQIQCGLLAVSSYVRKMNV